MTGKTENRYSALISKIFANHFEPGVTEFVFHRSELKDAASELEIRLPENLGDIVYSFRYRAELPEEVRQHLPQGWSWMIWPAGKATYKFIATDRDPVIAPNPALPVTKIPDSTPGVIARYALTDEQALLAKLNYCRILDVFTGLACYRLQSHLRTTVSEMGQVESDDVYIGIDRRGAHYALPVQAKGKKDWLSVVQVAQDIAMSSSKFPNLVCRAISAQFMLDGSIAIFAFEPPIEGHFPLQVAERHYRLVPQEELSLEELNVYASRPIDPFV